MSAFAQSLEVPIVYERAVSGESRAVERQMEEIRKHNEETITLGWRKALKDRVDDLVSKYSTSGWDGGDALPLSLDSSIWAKQVIEWLPEAIATPDIAPEPSGEITLEWSGGKNLVFSLTLEGRTALYAALLGATSKRYGEEVLGDKLPEEIYRMLQDYFSKT